MGSFTWLLLFFGSWCQWQKYFEDVSDGSQCTSYCNNDLKSCEAIDYNKKTKTCQTWTNCPPSSQKLHKDWIIYEAGIYKFCLNFQQKRN